MKLKIFISFISLAFLSCNKLDDKMNKQNSTISIKANKEMRKVYFLRFNFKANAEIYFNGILLQKMTEDGISGGNIILNPYIVKTGTQNVSIKLDKFMGKPLSKAYLQDVFIEIYYSENYNENNDDFPLELIQKLSLPEYKTDQNVILNTWEFLANVDYKNNDELGNAMDLSKDNPASLLNDVLKKYQENEEILNNGNTQAYLELVKNRLDRETTSMYYTNEEKQKYIQKVLQRVKNAKGIMQPLTDYHLKIHPNNKIVTLINSQGSPVLSSKDNTGKTNTFSLQLYRDKNTGQLKVY